jgi:hypothetical protein
MTRKEIIEKKVCLNLNYFATIDNPNLDFNDLMKKEFYAAKDYLFGLGYDSYVEEKALPLNPKDSHLFTPLATYRVQDGNGNFDWFNIFAMALGGMLVTNEI